MDRFWRTYEGQVQQAFNYLQHAGSPTVTRLRYYVVGYRYPESLAAITAAKRLVTAEDEPLPTSVLVGVPALGHPVLLFEVEATAVAKLWGNCKQAVGEKLGEVPRGDRRPDS